MAIFQTYTVRRGDTLDGIAKVFGLTRQALMSLNGIVNANRIRIGQVLRVRRVSESFKVAPAGSTVRDLAARTGVPADQIAKANGVNHADLLSVNPGVNWSKLKVGDKVKLPTQ